MHDKSIHHLFTDLLPTTVCDCSRINFQDWLQYKGSACIFQIELFEVGGIEEEDGNLLLTFLLCFITVVANLPKENVMV